MCSICASSLCSGTGGCEMVVRQAPEMIKISYNYANNYLTLLQGYFFTVLAITKDSFSKFLNYFRRW